MKGDESVRLETNVLVDGASDVSDQSVEGGSWQQVAHRLLVLFDLSESDRAGLELKLFLCTVGLALGGLLHASLGRCSLLVDFLAGGRDLLGRSFLGGNLLTLWRSGSNVFGLWHKNDESLKLIIILRNQIPFKL